MPRRITAELLEQATGDVALTDFAGRDHLYFRKLPAAPEPDYVKVDVRQRALCVFLCPAEAPGPADAPMLRRLFTGHAVGEIGAAFLFTAADAIPADLPTDRTAVGPMADSALRAALRWVERPGRARLQTGLVVLCHGERWPKGGMKALAMEDRRAVLWSGLRAFKRLPRVFGSGQASLPVNPLTANPQLNPGLATVWKAADGGETPRPGCTSWWVWPPR